MKVLLSAYACEPDRGSEPGVGWHWAIEMARLGHDVWVLTRKNNREVIQNKLGLLTEASKLHFIYYDLPRWAKWWKSGGRGIRTYNFLWQWGAYRYVKGIHATVSFDLVHHITFGVVRQPSFMGGLCIPFIFGPLGGGESAPWRLRRSYSLKGLALDFVRDVLNALVKIDPFMFYTFTKANKIYAKTPETKGVIPKRFWPKVEVTLEIGIEEQRVGDSLKSTVDDGKPFRLLFVGRFTYLKGMDLGIRAFAHLLEKIPSARLTMVGKGGDKVRWQRLSKRLGVDSNIDWVSWMPQAELPKLYAQHDVFLFPSLHDSSGNVILEALSCSLPVVCLDLGGPNEIVNKTCGRVIETKGQTESEVSQSLGDALVMIASDIELYSELKLGAVTRSKEFTWEQVVGRVYQV